MKFIKSSLAVSLWLSLSGFSLIVSPNEAIEMSGTRPDGTSVSLRLKYEGLDSLVLNDSQLQLRVSKEISLEIDKVRFQAFEIALGQKVNDTSFWVFHGDQKVLVDCVESEEALSAESSFCDEISVRYSSLPSLPTGTSVKIKLDLFERATPTLGGPVSLPELGE